MSDEGNRQLPENEVEADLTPDVLAALKTIRDAGFAVCAFTPTELRGADVRRVEDQLCESGWDVIDILAGSSR